MSLFDDIFFGDIDTKIQSLADKTDEDWNGSYGNNSVLRYYLEQTYNRLIVENKVYKDTDRLVFNTGLFTKMYEPIYGYSEKNMNYPYKGNQQWFLKCFCTSYELGKNNVGDFPQRANYFDNPALLVYNANLPLNVQIEHILSDEDNVKRLPVKLQNNQMAIAMFSGAVEIMKKKVMANYKLAVPQYYNGIIQLLLPISLESPDVVDLALVVTNCGNYYQGHTCLSLEMAYSNARLIAKPESNWLKIG